MSNVTVRSARLAGKARVAGPRQFPAANNFISINDDELVRHPDLAYEDGYADARQWDKDGFFISSRYNEAARLRYEQGFKAGLRVKALL